MSVNDVYFTGNSVGEPREEIFDIPSRHDADRPSFGACLKTLQMRLQVPHVAPANKTRIHETQAKQVSGIYQCANVISTVPKTYGHRSSRNDISTGLELSHVSGGSDSLRSHCTGGLPIILSIRVRHSWPKARKRAFELERSPADEVCVTHPYLVVKVQVIP
ncbi:hypothetical protein BDR03DRAFT_1064409 [Suillus americanus]|nr:hypothetical protein BDR03DRAFT_1064409 [Suillus americanus]